MERKPNELNDEGQDVPMTSEPNEKGPFRFPSKEDDPDVANDEPGVSSDDDDDEFDDDLDVDADDADSEVEER